MRRMPLTVIIAVSLATAASAYAQGGSLWVPEGTLMPPFAISRR
jgi:hypothetical protein